MGKKTAVIDPQAEPTLDEPMSLQEKLAYDFRLEQIDEGVGIMQKGWQLIAEAVQVIRDQRLYRQDFATFEAFCEVKLEITYRRINQLISANKTIENLGTQVPILPETEKQVRPLAALPAAEQSAAWEEAVELSGGQQPTAATVKQVVEQRKAQAEPPPLHDFQEGEFVKCRGLTEPGLVIETTDSMLKAEVPQGNGVSQVWVTASVGVERCEAPIDGELVDLEPTTQYLQPQEPEPREWEEGDLVRAIDQHGREVTGRLKAIGHTMASLEDESRITLATATLIDEPEQEQELSDEELKQEMYTPDAVIEVAKWVLECDKFDLDPCSNSHQNPNLPVHRTFTRADDGLNKRWLGETMLFNPPYSPNGTIKPWVQKWLSAHESGYLRGSLGLFPHYTAESWFNLFNPYLVGAIAGRLQYKNTNGKARFSSCLVYLGNKPERFVEGAKELCNGNIRRVVLLSDFKG